jgi:hypothetical protein
MDRLDPVLMLPPLYEPVEDDQIRVVAQTSLFRSATHRRYQAVPHGATLLELVLESGMGELKDGVIQLPGMVVVLPCCGGSRSAQWPLWNRYPGNPRVNVGSPQVSRLEA